jgi:hypothetical protein
MRRSAFALAVILLAAPLFALDDGCDARLEHLRALYDLRALLLKSYTSSYDVQRFAERRIEELREPLPGGGYRWVRWVRPMDDGPTAKDAHNVMAVKDSGDPDRMEASQNHVYTVRVAVPRKRSLMNANFPVYVGTARITYEIGGRSRTREEAINQWMNPDTWRIIDLNGIADRVHVAVDVSTAQKNAKQAVAEIHFRKAVSEDDPDNPNYSTVRMLDRIRVSPDPVSVDAEIVAYERSLFPGSDPLPLLTLIRDLRRADTLMGSDKQDDVEKGSKLLKETLRRLR